VPISTITGKSLFWIKKKFIEDMQTTMETAVAAAVAAVTAVAAAAGSDGRKEEGTNPRGKGQREIEQLFGWESG
jgi:hypothetical protein